MTKVVCFVCFVLLKEGLCSLECKINGRERDGGGWGGWGLAGGCGNGRERDWKGTISKIWRLVIKSGEGESLRISKFQEFGEWRLSKEQPGF